MYHKKSLGQHFLHDNSFLDAIAQYLAAQKPQRIFEIGAGGGALTKRLLPLDYEHFKVLEIDKRYIEPLQLIVAPKALQTEILHSDILEQCLPFDKPFWAVGNFPYYISSSILFKLLEWKQYAVGIVGMFQKEVAERICSEHGSKKYGILSVMMQTYYDVHYLFDVPSEAFTPPPRVVSAVVAFTARKEMPLLEEKKLLTLVKKAFGQRRKMLRNSIGSMLHSLPKDKSILSSRPEQISLTEFHNLLQYLA